MASAALAIGSGIQGAATSAIGAATSAASGIGSLLSGTIQTVPGTAGPVSTSGKFSAGQLISSAADLFGGISSFVGARRQADLEDYNAELAFRRAEAQADRVERDRRRQIARFIVRQGAGGTIEGSPIEVLGDITAEAALDVALVRFGGAARARGHRFKAETARQRGTGSLLEGVLSAGSTLLSRSPSQIVTGSGRD